MKKSGWKGSGIRMKLKLRILKKLSFEDAKG